MTREQRGKFIKDIREIPENYDADTYTWHPVSEAVQIKRLLELIEDLIWEIPMEGE